MTLTIAVCIFVLIALVNTFFNIYVNHKNSMLKHNIKTLEFNNFDLMEMLKDQRRANARLLEELSKYIKEEKK